MCLPQWLDPLQLVLVVFFSHQLEEIHSLHSWWSSPATPTGGVFMSSTSANIVIGEINATVLLML